MMEGFKKETLHVNGVDIVLRHGGEGPPLLLMHGNPFTHLSWNRVAPDLAKRFTVVTPDLRGYGDSSKPDGGKDHYAYSFREMGKDMVEVMGKLGFERFSAAGHDRGARVLHRMCLDHPDRIRKACFVDMLPQHHLLNNVTFNWGKFSWHWFFMIQPTPYPETMISNDAEFFLRKKLSKTDQGTNFFVPEALAEYIRCIKNPRTVYAMCEDYRATVSCDFDMDTADFNAGNKITPPLMVLWGQRSHTENVHGDVLSVWKANYATDAWGGGIACGHYVNEEAPDQTYDYLMKHFTG
jgi:haloacetate dehalogenase